MSERTDWTRVADRIAENDRVALSELNRLVTGFLAANRAFDFRDDWDDIVQDVVVAFVDACQNRQLRDRRAAKAYIRQATRFKFLDLLSRRSRWKQEGPILRAEAAVFSDPCTAVRSLEVGHALSRLSERRRSAVTSVKICGKTVAEYSRESGVPLGTAKRDLREGLHQLRSILGPRPSRDRRDTRVVNAASAPQ